MTFLCYVTLRELEVERSDLLNHILGELDTVGGDRGRGPWAGVGVAAAAPSSALLTRDVTAWGGRRGGAGHS